MAGAPRRTRSSTSVASVAVLCVVSFSATHALLPSRLGRRHPVQLRDAARRSAVRSARRSVGAERTAVSRLFQAIENDAERQTNGHIANSTDTAVARADASNVLRIDNSDGIDRQDKDDTGASTKEMLRFVIPALGIFLANPLLSNIDNAFIGRTVGTQGLAALSPATICTDQMLYLFSFLGRATTGLVSEAYGTNKDVDAARNAAAAPLTVSLLCGVVLSIVYALFTPSMLAALNVNPALRPAAASYVYWRGGVSWATFGQVSALSAIMSTRDAITPLKIIAMAAVVNVLGDAALCVWPLQLGCAGAAAATSLATVISTAFMCRALMKKNMFPKLKLPSKKEWSALLEYTGPLMAVTFARLIGTVAMQRRAMALGVSHMAGYQLSINLMFFFLLFGEPISQLSQTTLPALLADAEKNPDNQKTGAAVRKSFKGVLKFGAVVSVLVGFMAGLALKLGAGLFTSDTAVQLLAEAASPSMFVTVAVSIFTIAVDGAMLASRDFGFMLSMASSSLLLQLYLLKNFANSLSAIYYTFSLRLGMYAVLALARTFAGRGILGKFYRKQEPVDR